jgi:subtilisin-like proprotein convertase family protein
LAGNAFYGEPANGAWTLKVVDGASGPSGTQTLNSWAVRIFGH